MPREFPIGTSEYTVVAAMDFYIDKTLMIKDVIDDGAKVSLFTRPRRFGKSLNISMLKAFFEKADEDTSIYFKDKKIWACGEEYTQHQGKYPVICIDFKSVAACSTWDRMYARICDVLSDQADIFEYLLDSNHCSRKQRTVLQRLIDRESDEVDVERALLTLSKMLYAHHKTPVVILIDECDAPIQTAYTNGFYDRTIEFMRGFLSNGLKGNPYLKCGLLTGIMRVAQESIFSGFNNVKVYAVTDSKFGEYFGFTDLEMETLVPADKLDLVREWYNGYLIGGTRIYNPWSVMYFMSENCVPAPYWVNTSSNKVLIELLRISGPEVIEMLNSLLFGQQRFTRILSYSTHYYYSINEQI